MLKPYGTNIQYFIKEKSGMLVAGWISDVGNKRYGDYEYVGTREQGEKLLDKLKSRGIIVEDAEEGSKIESYGVSDVKKELMRN